MTSMWVVTRSTGLVALALLTASTVLGVVVSSGWQSERWPLLVLNGLHRNISLLAMAMVVGHAAVVVIDAYVPIGWLDVVIPFGSTYERIGTGLGSLGFVLMVVVSVNGYLRGAVRGRAWLVIHLTGYLAWVFGTAHGLAVATDDVLTAVVAGVGVVAVAAAWVLRIRVRTAHGLDVA